MPREPVRDIRRPCAQVIPAVGRVFKCPQVHLVRVKHPPRRTQVVVRIIPRCACGGVRTFDISQVADVCPRQIAERVLLAHLAPACVPIVPGRSASRCAEAPFPVAAVDVSNGPFIREIGRHVGEFSAVAVGIRRGLRAARLRAAQLLRQQQQVQETIAAIDQSVEAEMDRAAEGGPDEPTSGRT